MKLPASITNIFTCLAITLLMAACSGDLPPENTRHRTEQPLKDYWNDPVFLQPVLDSCKDFFFPDYFPLRETASLYKKIIPGDTIVYCEFFRKKIALKNGEVLWCSTDKTGNKPADLQSDKDIPFLTWVFKSDSLMNLWFCSKNELLHLSDAESMASDPVSGFDMWMPPCVSGSISANCSASSQWLLKLNGLPVKDTLRINKLGTEINYKAQEEYYSKRNKLSASELKPENPVYVTEKELPCIRMNILYQMRKITDKGENMNAGHAESKNTSSANYIIWFQRDTGPVKIHCLENNVIYLMSDAN